MNWLQKIAQTREDDEGWVPDASGRTYWGSQGSGCLFFRKHPQSGFQILITKRGAGVDEPNTWGTTGGAVPPGQDLFEMAKEETIEELGSFPSDYKVVNEWTYKAEGGTFTYTNYIIEVFNLQWMDTWKGVSGSLEVSDARWVSLDEVSQYDLHFGLSALLNAIKF